MTKIGEGHKSEVFLLDDGRILKLFFPHFAGLAPEEADIAAILARAEVDAPRVEDVVEVEGRPGIIFGNLSVGMTISAAVRKQPWRLAAFARELAVMHAAVHDCTSHDLPSQRQRLIQEIESGNLISAQLKTAALYALETLPDADTVCHNDIHMLNVIVHPVHSKIIDWMLATRGNALADVASAVLQLRFGEQPNGLLARSALELGRALFWRTYLRHYLKVRPAGVNDLARWELPVAVALAGRREGRMQRQLVHRIGQIMSSGTGDDAGIRT